MSFTVSPDVPSQDGSVIAPAVAYPSIVNGQISLGASVAPQFVDNFDTATFQATKYSLTITQAGEFQAVEVMLLCDGVDSFIETYGLMSSTGVPLAAFSAIVTAGVVSLNVSLIAPTAATANFQASRIFAASDTYYTRNGTFPPNTGVVGVPWPLNTPYVTVQGLSGTDITAAFALAIATGYDVFVPAGTFYISSQLSPQSNQTIFGEGAQTTLKVAPGTYLSGSQFFSISGKDKVTIRDLTLDGNKGNIGTARRQITTVFNSTNVTYRNVRFQNCEGICILLSTSASDLTVANCGFYNCGGNPNNSDGYRRQGIAFSNGGAYRRIKLTNNTFYMQGLDSISLAGCFDVDILGNVCESVYSFVFSNPGVAQTCSNVNIVGNIVDKAGEFNISSGSVPANTIGLTYVNGAVIVGNTFNTLDCGAISVGANCTNFEVVANVIVNPGQATTLWICGINVGGSQVASNISNITVAQNTIVDTNGTALMPYGIIVADDAANVSLKDNNIKNWLMSKYGRYPHASGVSGNVTALTSNTGIASTVFIHDLDLANGVQTSWRAMNTLTGYQVNGLSAVLAGSGSPAGVVVAPVGTMYIDQTGGKLYVHETGGGTSTGWVAK